MGSRRTLARALEAVEDFDEPSVDLEQYLTSPELAAHLCHFARLQGDLEERTVVDLGTGTGMLAIGASVVEPERVVGVEVDGDALAVARRNERRVLRRRVVDWIRADVSRPPLGVTDATVISNPPFGAQRGRRHADRRFLETARDLGAVSYTVHNERSRSFVESFAADEGGEVTHAFAGEIPVDRRFDFHEAERTDLPVEVYRIEWSMGSE